MRRFLEMLVVVFLVQGSPFSASAAVLYWDGDGTPPLLGGDGTWDASTPNWFWQDQNAYQAWNNSGNDDAVFGTAGGLVNVSTPVSVHSITLQTPGYVLSGSPITLTGTSPTISVAGNTIGTIGSQILGTSGLVKSGTGLLDLTSTNSYSGTTTVSAGVLRLTNWYALPGGFSGGGGSNLNIAGGIVELPAGSSLYRSLGTGSSQMRLTGSGGFSAYNPSGVPGTATVYLSGGTLAWGGSNFVPNGCEFQFSSPWSNSTVNFVNSINLGNTSRTIRVYDGSADVDASLSGSLSGSGGGLNKVGDGTLLLSGASYYTGATVVAGGVLRLGNSNAIPGGVGTTGGTSHLNLAGGVIDVAMSSYFPGMPVPVAFSRSLGTGASQVEFTGSGGFQVNCTAPEIQYVYSDASPIVFPVNLGGSGGSLTWGSGRFVPDGATLVLGSNSSTVALDFQNPINLGASNRTIEASQGLARLSSALTGTGGFTKTGTGILELPVENLYSGPTVVSEGILRLSHPKSLPGGIAATGGSSNLVIAGGLVELCDGDFQRGLGTGPDQVQFTASGGFAAFAMSPSQYGPPLAPQTRVVNLGGQSAQVSWGSGGFVPDGAALILRSSASAVNAPPGPQVTLDFQNPIDLGSSLRTIQVDGESSYTNVPPLTAVTLSGGLSGNGGIVKTGDGILNLTAPNTYSGETQVTSGVLQLAHPEALPGGIGPTGGTSHLLLAGGGKIGLDSADFQRSLGAGPAQFQFSGSGGFAGGSHHVVNLGGASATVVWDGNAYLPDDCTLILENVDSDGPMDFQNPLTLGPGKRTVAVFAGSGDTHARLSGVIDGVGGLKKTGGLVLDLTAANSYTGQTEVGAGVLRLSHAEALPGGIGTVGGISNLNFTGSSTYELRQSSGFSYSTGDVCVVELATGDFTRTLGTGASQVQFNGSGGFSAYGADRVVNLGGVSASVAWATSCFVPDGSRLCLSSNYSNATVSFQNPIDLGSSVRTIMVGNGTAAVDARLTGTLSGTGGLEKTGGGTLDLSVANTYSGQTNVDDGALRLSHPNSLPGGTGLTGGTSNLSFSSYSGVVELACGDFYRALGTGPSQVQFNTYMAGGFAAVGADRVVNLGGAAAPVTLGQNYFPSTLILGSSSADATVDFQNPIAVGPNTWQYEIQVAKGLAAVDAKLSGVLSGSTDLEKTGDGTLLLTAANSYSGTWDLSAGKLLVDGSLSGSALVLWPGAALGGSGTIGSVTVYSNGIIAPGDSVGALTLAGALTLEAGAKLDFDLGTLGSSDEILMTGCTLNLNGQQFSDFDFNTLAGFGQGTYVLIDAGAITGSLGDDCSGTIDGLQATLLISGNDLLLTVVPEPSTLALVVAGVLGLLVLCWRRAARCTVIRS